MREQTEVLREYFLSLLYDDKAVLSKVSSITPGFHSLPLRYIWGDLKCVNTDGTPIILSQATRFFTRCFLSTFALVVVILLLGSTAYRFYDLLRDPAGKPTVRGQVSSLLALAVPLLSMWHMHAPIDVFVFTFGLIIAGLQVVQDGRVAVSSPEVLLYWAAMAVTYLGWFIDALIRHDSPITMGFAAALAVAVVCLEVWNSEREPTDSYDDTSVYAKFATTFINSALKEGAATGTYTFESFPAPPKSLSSEHAYARYSRILEEVPAGRKYRSLVSLMKLLNLQLPLLMVLSVANELVDIITPRLLQLMLKSMHGFVEGSSPIFETYYFATLFAIFPMAVYGLSAIYMQTRSTASILSRVALMSAVYRKGLSIAPSARKEYDSAKFMSLISVDTFQVFDIIFVLPGLVSSLIGVALSFSQLWQLLGPSIASAAFVYIAFVPITSLMSSKFAKTTPELRKLSDIRTKATANVFRNIKSLKLYAWEEPFYERVTSARRDELGLLRFIQLVSTVLGVIWNSIGDCVAIVVFVTFLYLRTGTLSPEILFPSLLYLNLASVNIVYIPNLIPSIFRVLNASDRIDEALALKDFDNSNYSRSNAASSDLTVELKEACVSWDDEDSDATRALTNITFSAVPGDLVCIIGRVGAGKSALLRALGGDLPVTSGRISVSGSMSYCSQEPWLQNMTIRDNVLFGQEYREEWFEKVVDACELRDDINQMPRRDLTEIGERGITLSGGQKARLAMARAVYSRSDIVLLDDVLSAVDEHVGQALIRKVLSPQGILSNRTIVLATNNVKILSESSLIVALQDGNCVERLSFKDVVREGNQSKTYRLIEEFGHPEALDTDPEFIVERRDLVKASAAASGAASVKADDDVASGASTVSGSETGATSPSSATMQPLPTLEQQPFAASALVMRSQSDDQEEKEDRQESSIFHTFKRYFTMLPPYYYLAIVISLALSSLITNTITVFLGYISNQNFTSLSQAKSAFIVFGCIVLLKSTMDGVSKVAGKVVISVKVSQIIHDKMLWGVLHAPMSFFDTTPMGQLINRFSRDLSLVDYSIPSMARYFLELVINLLITTTTIIFGAPLVAVFMIPLFFFGNQTRRLYVPAQRQVTRMLSAANSPILSHIEDSIKGQATLQAFDRTATFIENHDKRVDYWIRISFFNRNLGFWLGFHMKIISVVLSWTTALCLTTFIGWGLVSVGYAAAVNNFAVRAGSMVGAIISYIAEMEMNSVALERVLEYIDKEQEAAPHIEATMPPASWPTHGAVHVEHLVARYKEDAPDVLKDLEFSINANEKIGVVGRTGSGKSTLTMAIFRIIEARSGTISIDERDISLLGLGDLRSHLSIIPQDAQVFNGSIRSNLDPLETVDDARLWEVLDLCHLKGRLEQQGKTLDTELSDGGLSLSRGESQLLCLGRALVRNSKILLLDEATASVDMETDKLVQETIRANFADRTIITIAHRLNTIMDSDSILVLDHGEVVEFDSPGKLLDAKGVFYKMVNAARADDTEDNLL